MAEKKLPFRMMIAKSFCDDVAKDYREVMVELAPEFGKEGQFTVARIQDHLMALKAVGILKEDEAIFGEGNEVLQKYRITNYGQDKVHQSN